MAQFDSPDQNSKNGMEITFSVTPGMGKALIEAYSAPPIKGIVAPQMETASTSNETSERKERNVSISWSVKPGTEKALFDGLTFTPIDGK
jgi:hypothetical protein